ncbi:MAG: DUF126 domain-containing protein [Actinomycetia bacterium]|nr:DUF126 domain-containing protein [Actinomycetes bacterium]
MASDIEVLVPGQAQGIVVRLEEPLSFWGGFDPKTGAIIDHRHPQLGVSLTDHIVVMTRGRGSSSSTGVLAEAIRIGTAPAAIVLREPDLIIALGALVANDLYGTSCPVIVADDRTFAALRTGCTVDIAIEDGAITFIDV